MPQNEVWICTAGKQNRIPHISCLKAVWFLFMYSPLGEFPWTLALIFSSFPTPVKKSVSQWDMQANRFPLVSTDISGGDKNIWRKAPRGRRIIALSSRHLDSQQASTQLNSSTFETKIASVIQWPKNASSFYPSQQLVNQTKANPALLYACIQTSALVPAILSQCCEQVPLAYDCFWTNGSHRSHTGGNKRKGSWPCEKLPW